jgi:hypothetical protein
LTFILEKKTSKKFSIEISFSGLGLGTLSLETASPSGVKSLLMMFLVNVLNILF